jgi:hypothetical protein
MYITSSSRPYPGVAVRKCHFLAVNWRPENFGAIFPRQENDDIQNMVTYTRNPAVESVVLSPSTFGSPRFFLVSDYA